MATTLEPSIANGYQPEPVSSRIFVRCTACVGVVRTGDEAADEEADVEAADEEADGRKHRAEASPEADRREPRLLSGAIRKRLS